MIKLLTRQTNISDIENDRKRKQKEEKEALGKNPRWAMMCRLAEKMDDTKMNQHLLVANDYRRYNYIPYVYKTTNYAVKRRLSYMII